MIKLSKLTDYAVVILAELARRDGELMSASGLSAATGLPEPTVSKVLKILARHELILSSRGVNGGYSLETKPHDLQISTIITAMEGPIALTACVDGSTDTCGLEGACAMHGRWNPVNTALKTALDSVTLADLLPPACIKQRMTEREIRI